MSGLPTFDNLLTIEDFAPYVGTALRVDATPGMVDIRLDRVERQPPHPVNLREPFTLFFSTPFSALLVAGIYRMRARDGRVVEIDMIWLFISTAIQLVPTSVHTSGRRRRTFRSARAPMFRQEPE